jgi:hypothetical protein
VGPFKWAKAPGVKFGYGGIHKRQFLPRLQLEFRPIKIVVASVWWPPKFEKSSRVKFNYEGRQQCVVKDMDHFKSKCS